MKDLSRAARAAGRGDRDGLNALVRATQGDVWRLCAHLADPAVADELARETYRRALPRLRRRRGSAAVRTLLLSVAYQACTETSVSRLGAGNPAQRGPGPWPTARRLAELELSLAALAPDERGAFVLTQLLGCGYAEAAEISGCQVDAIRSRVSRARDDLGSMLAPDTAEPVSPAPAAAQD